MLKKLLMLLFIAPLLAMDNDHQQAFITVTNKLPVLVVLDGKAVFGNTRRILRPKQTASITISEHATQGFVVWVQPGFYYTMMFPLYQKLTKGQRYTITSGILKSTLKEPRVYPEQPGNFNASIDFSESGYPDFAQYEVPKSEKKVRFNMRDKGRTELHEATFFGKLGEAKYLILEGAELDQQDECGVTPLHNAAATGYMNMVNLFLAHQETLKINAQDNHGATPLLVALTAAHQKVAIALMRTGAAVHLANDNGLTPLHVAAAGGLRAAVHNLLQRGADPFARTKKLSPKAQDSVLPIQCTQDNAIHSLLYQAMEKKIAEFNA